MNHTRLLMIATMLSVSMHSVANAQELNCPDACMPFEVCNGQGGRSIVCTKNPHTVTTGGVQWTPFKQAGTPICIDGYALLNFVDASGNPAPALPLRDQIGNWTPVFIVDDQIDDLLEAEDMWTNLCPPSGQEPECCIEIRYSNNADDFGGVTAAKITAASADFVRNLYTCRADCNAKKPSILINITQEWRFENKDPSSNWVESDRMWYTGTTVPTGVAYRPDVKLISLREIVAHEIGHWYGMRHLIAGEGEPYGDCNDCPNYPGSVMFNGPEPDGTTVYDRDARTLSEADICAFKKLYCPNEVPLGIDTPPEIFNPNPDIRIYPNPVGGKAGTVASIEFNVHELGDITVQIVDINGREVLNRQVHASRIGWHTIPFDSAKLPSGHYFCTIARTNHHTKNGTLGIGVIKVVK